MSCFLGLFGLVYRCIFITRVTGLGKFSLNQWRGSIVFGGKHTKIWGRYWSVVTEQFCIGQFFGTVLQWNAFPKNFQKMLFQTYVRDSKTSFPTKYFGMENYRSNVFRTKTGPKYFPMFRFASQWISGRKKLLPDFVPNVHVRVRIERFSTEYSPPQTRDFLNRGAFFLV